MSQNNFDECTDDSRIAGTSSCDYSPDVPPPQYEFPDPTSLVSQSKKTGVKLRESDQALVAQDQYRLVCETISGLTKSHPQATVNLTQPLDAEVLNALVERGYDVSRDYSFSQVNDQDPEESYTLTVGLPGSTTVEQDQGSSEPLIANLVRELYGVKGQLSNFIHYPSLFASRGFLF